MSLVIGGRVPVWRIRERMAAAGIPSIKELHRRLQAADPDCVKYAQFALFVERVPIHVSLRTLLGVAVVLGCEPGDLIGSAAATNQERRQ